MISSRYSTVSAFENLGFSWFGKYIYFSHRVHLTSGVAHHPYLLAYVTSYNWAVKPSLPVMTLDLLPAPRPYSVQKVTNSHVPRACSYSFFRPFCECFPGFSLSLPGLKVLLGRFPASSSSSPRSPTASALPLRAHSAY